MLCVHKIRRIAVMKFLSKFFKQSSVADPYKEFEEFLIIELSLYPERWIWNNDVSLSHKRSKQTVWGDFESKQVYSGVPFGSNNTALWKAFCDTRDICVDLEVKYRTVIKNADITKQLRKFQRIG